MRSKCADMRQLLNQAAQRRNCSPPRTAAMLRGSSELSYAMQKTDSLRDGQNVRLVELHRLGAADGQLHPRLVELGALFPPSLAPRTLPLSPSFPD